MEGAVPTSSTPTAPISAKAMPRLVSSSGAPATPKSAPSAEPEAIPMTQALHPEKLETSSGERGSRPSKAVFPEAHPLAQTRASLSAEPVETVAQTEAGQPEAASSSDAEADSANVWERAALRTERAAIPITTEPETISESQPLPAKSGTAASPAAPTEGPANPLNAGQEAVSEEEMAALPLRDEAQATVEETRLRNEVADRSEPIRRPAPTASDSAADGIEGEHKPVATPVAASAHASPIAHTERAQTPSAAEQQDRVRVVEQILQKLETMRLTQGRQEITLHLKPEHLGRLQVTIVTDRENVFARIVAENPQIRQAVESGRDALREALEQRGMTLQHLDVSSQQGYGGGRQMPFDPEPFASSARAYRVSGHAEAEKTETPRPSVVTPSRLAGRVDYVA
jgi:flagellar hook-length control protein FliK